jgi:glycosyltransferase involved in cell wall biosynthesis
VELSIDTVVKEVRNRAKFQIVHVQQPHLQSLIAALLGRVLGKPSVVTLHVRPPVAGGWLRQFAQRFVCDFSLRLADQSVAVSPFVAESFRPHPVRTIENGVDVDAFRPKVDGRRRVRASLRLGDETTFLFAGRWTSTKGLDILIRASDSEILARLPFKVVLLGEPSPDDPALVEDQLRGLNHPSHILLVGSIGTELPDYLSAGDVFVAPSLYEGMPLAFLEAMATGLPVLASDIPVHRLLIDRAGVGWLFPSGSSDGLAALMKNIIERGIPKLWPEHARAMVLRHHELRYKVSEYLALYEALVNHRT